MSESFKRALNAGGWLAVGINAGATVGVGIVVGGLVMSVFSILAWSGGSFQHIAVVPMLALLFVFGLPGWLVMGWAAAGLIGSMQDALEGREVTFSSYVQAGLRNFWRYIGYSILYGVLVLFAVAVVGVGTVLVLRIIDSGFRAVTLMAGLLLWFVAFWANFTVALPLTVLSVAGYGRWDVISRHIGVLTLLTVLLLGSAAVPFGLLVAMPLYELYILSLWHDDHPTDQVAVPANASPQGSAGTASPASGGTSLWATIPAQESGAAGD